MATEVRALAEVLGDQLRTRVDHGVVMAGFPSPSQDYTTAENDLSEHLMPNRASTYLVRARGHSMTGELAARLESMEVVPRSAERGYQRLYLEQVTQAEDGLDFAFLQPAERETPVPVIKRD